MSRSIARVPVFVTAFLLSTAFALATLLSTVPAAHAVETTTFSQKLSSALCVRSPELTEQISAALADGIVSAKQEAFVDESRAGRVLLRPKRFGTLHHYLRRDDGAPAAFLDDRADWQSIDLASVTADGWSSSGVKWHFATGGYEVGIVDVEGNAESLRELLAQHPEGIAAYDPGVPHAVLLTDYDEETGTFYCADPANYYAGSRIPLAESWNGACRGQKPGCRHCRILARLGDSVAKAGL